MLPQFSDDEIKAVSTTGNRKPFNSVAGGNIQRCFGHIGIDTKWIWQTHYCPFLLMRYGVRTTVRVSDEWLSVCAICLHTGLNPKGHRLHTFCQICSLLMITKNQDTRWKNILNAQGRNVPCVSCPHRLLLWCQTSEALPCRFVFVSIINAPGLVNGYKPFYYRRQRTYSQCRYVFELNSKFCADYSM